jgi:hypothetical protein
MIHQFRFVRRFGSSVERSERESKCLSHLSSQNVQVCATCESPRRAWPLASATRKASRSADYTDGIGQSERGSFSAFRKALRDTSVGRSRSIPHSPLKLQSKVTIQSYCKSAWKGSSGNASSRERSSRDRSFLVTSVCRFGNLSCLEFLARIALNSVKWSLTQGLSHAAIAS